MNTIKRAALYIRVSTEEQARHGYSLEAQQADLANYAVKNGYYVTDHYIDEGASARKSMNLRKEFQRLMRDVKLNKIDIIIFIKLDRWFRNIADYYKVQTTLDEYGVEWACSQEDYNTTTTNGRLMLNLKLSIAQNESDQTSDRIKFVFKNKVKNGEIIAGMVPYGYEKKDKHLMPHPETAPQMQDIFRHFALHQSVMGTLQYARENYGITWRRISLRRALQNKSYIGTRHGIEGFCPAIIEQHLFDRVQIIMQSRRTKKAPTGRIYLFTGLIRCPKCGRILAGNRGNLNPKTGKYDNFYYVCQNRIAEKTCDWTKSVFERTLERYLLAKLHEQLTSYVANIEMGSTTNKSPLKKIEQVKAKLDRLKDLYIDGLLDKTAYKADYEKYNSEIAQLLTISNETHQEVRSDLKTLLKQDIDKVYAALSIKGRRSFWHSIISHIELVPKPLQTKEKPRNNFKISFLT